MKNSLILALALVAGAHYAPLKAARPHARLTRIKVKGSRIPGGYRLHNQRPARASFLIHKFKELCAFAEMLKTIQAADSVEENVARFYALSAKHDETVSYMGHTAQISPYYHRKLTNALEVISWQIETVKEFLKRDAALQRDTVVADALVRYNELMAIVDPSLKEIDEVFGHLNRALNSIMGTKVAAREGQERSVRNALKAVYYLKRQTEAALAGLQLIPLALGAPAVEVRS